MKRFIVLSLFIFSTLILAAEKSAELRSFQLDYIHADGGKVKAILKGDDMSLSYDVLDQSDFTKTVFKVTLLYKIDKERESGHKAYDVLKSDFTDVTDDPFTLTFTGAEVATLKYFKGNEFGDAYIIIINHASYSVNLQFQIRFGDPNSQEFHEIINSLTNKAPTFLEVLEN
jgi:hypothetical protein